MFQEKDKNSELPVSTGWKEREDKKLIGKSRALGAIASAIVAAVDISRECADDISAAKKDFEEEVFEDPVREAIELCDAVPRMINEKMCGHLVKALKMVGTEYALNTLGIKFYFK